MRAPRGLVADVVRFSWVDGPGNRFVLFLQGCNLDCLACHNPHTIPTTSRKARSMGVADVLDQVRPLAGFLSGVTVSGGEPTRQVGFLHTLFSALGRPADEGGLPGLTRFVDSNGVVAPQAWDELLPVTDGVMLDLKALDPSVHLALTGSDNAPVLDSIRRCAAAGKLYEVRLLLVPGHNDDAATLRATADWLLAVDPDVRVKAIGFRAHGVRSPARTWPEPTADQRAAYAEVLTGSGVRHLELV